jgi:hypothetical protein
MRFTTCAVDGVRCTKCGRFQLLVSDEVVSFLALATLVFVAMVLNA